MTITICLSLVGLTSICWKPSDTEWFKMFGERVLAQKKKKMFFKSWEINLIILIGGGSSHFEGTEW